MNRYAGMLVCTLAVLPAQGWAQDYDCQVFDRTINKGQGSDARDGDVPVQADSETAAEQRVRHDYPAWKDDVRYAVHCRASEE